MTTKQSNQSSGDNQQYDDIEYDFYCDGLEGQYEQAKEEGLFEFLKVFDLDKKHSDSDLVEAVDYFNETGGIVGEDAPMDFFDEREKRAVNRDGKFRPGLYCMLLSMKFSKAVDNKSAFLKHSYKI